MTSASSAETMIKGASLRARLDFVEREYGSEHVTKVIGSLNEDDQATIRLGVLPSSWYPLELNARVDEAIARVLNPGDPEAVFRLLGKASAEQNLQSFHKIFLRGKGPHDILADFPSVRRTYYSDGSASYTRGEDRSGVLCVTGASSHTQADCVSTASYFERAIELMGGLSSEVTLKRCRHYGDPSCEFHCQWK